MLKFTILFSLPAVASSFLFSGRNQSDWNGLKVTWNPNPLTAFNSLPRTRSEALSDGWVAMNPGAGCADNPNFKGERYIKDNDMGVILIYDSAGYVAGIQLGFPKNYRPNNNNYPFAALIDHPFVLDNGSYFITAYFVNPANICRGRTANQFKEEGTGTGLWIQNGTNPVTNSVEMPRSQQEASKTLWSKGSCFYTMGVHYWYNIRGRDTPCETIFPVFLLYNGGVLNAFGWAMAIDLDAMSNRIENPPHSSYGNFMNPVPDCLYKMGTLTTLHVFLTDSAAFDLC